MSQVWIAGWGKMTRLCAHLGGSWHTDNDAQQCLKVLRGGVKVKQNEFSADIYQGMS